MSQREDGSPDAGEGNPVTQTVDEDRVETLQTLLDQTRLTLVQQILAHDSGVLSVEELCYRNPETNEQTIDYHLRKLDGAEVVERHKLGEEQRNDLPNTYWGVTERGVDLLKQLGFYDEIDVLSTADDALERTDRIREIESFDARPTAGQ
jgi:DNA-binding HxlR family transcriptional regulator